MVAAVDLGAHPVAALCGSPTQRRWKHGLSRLELAVFSLPQLDQHAAAILVAAQMQFQRLREAKGGDGRGAAVPELPKIKM
ncbi:hypothetical protein DVH24_006348 [Malus domestica]|uniref:Uncharacterized protein n=1 Tax=Malus domestica TaxID=3750 RepID=A0A498KCE5_MALDO|nr:hypothetical protein DVH24_006348 [Malus domestica]